MDEQIKILIVGLGRAGMALHLPAYAQLSTVQVMAAVDPDDERRAEAEKRFGVKTYSNLTDALSAEKPDVVSICTPPQLHLEMTQQAFQAKAHVIVEKPIAMDLDQAVQMYDLADSHNLTLGVIHNQVYATSQRELINRVRNREIGDVLHIDTIWLSDGETDRMVQTRGFWCNELPGGRWAETLPHHLYIPYRLLGATDFDTAQSWRTHNKWPHLPGDEVIAHMSGDRCTLTVRLSANATEKLQQITVYGTAGVIAVNNLGIHMLAGKGAFPQSLKGSLSAIFSRIVHRLKSRDAKRGKSSHANAIEDILDSIRTGQPLDVGKQEVLWTMKSTIAIGKAIENSLVNDYTGSSL